MEIGRPTYLSEGKSYYIEVDEKNVELAKNGLEKFGAKDIVVLNGGFGLTEIDFTLEGDTIQSSNMKALELSRTFNTDVYRI